MRTLLRLALMLALFTGLTGGSVVHAFELSGHSEVTEATAWLHADGDHDMVPADADRNYPHHHNQCQGHDVAAPLKVNAAPQPVHFAVRLKPAVARVMIAAPPAPMLRPPIA